MNYYKHPNISNSDLSWLDNRLRGIEMRDLSEVYFFGNVIDAMLTEPEKINFIKMTLDDKQIEPEKFHIALDMKTAFLKDQYCKDLLSISKGQNEVYKDFTMSFAGFKFTLPVKIKMDFSATIGGKNFVADLKSTASTTQSQFEAAIKQFNYDKQAAFYMDVFEANQFVLIGLSKKAPHKIFKVFIDRNSVLYKTGQEKYVDLSYKWFNLFGTTNPNRYE